MDRRSLLRNRQTNTGATTKHARTIASHNGPWTIPHNADWERRDRLRNGPRSVNSGSPRNKLGTLCCGEERPVRKDGTCSKDYSSRKRQLGPRKCCERNGKELLNRLTVNNERDYERPDFDKNLGLPGTPTTRPSTGWIPTPQEEAIKPLRSGLHRRQKIVPKNIRATIVSLLHEGLPAIKKMKTTARHFWWPNMTEAIQKKCKSCPIRLLSPTYRTRKRISFLG